MVLRANLCGVVTSGRGLSAAQMAEPAVRERIEDMLGVPVVPGTLNVRLPEPIEHTPAWCYLPAEEIGPHWQARTGRSGYFLAAVLVAHRYRCMAFQADEPAYPADQIELIGEVHFRTTLRLGDGDPIQFCVLQAELREV